MKTEIDGVALAVFIFFFALVTVMGFVAARWRRPDDAGPPRRMGPGRPQVRHLDHLVPGRRRFLHRLHRHRGSGAGLRGRRLRLLRAAVHDHRLSRSSSWSCRGSGSWRKRQGLCHRGRRRAWPLRLARARACGRARPASSPPCRTSRCSWSAWRPSIKALGLHAASCR